MGGKHGRGEHLVKCGNEEAVVIRQWLAEVTIEVDFTEYRIIL